MMSLIFFGIVAGIMAAGYKQKFLRAFAVSIAGMFALYTAYWETPPLTRAAKEFFAVHTLPFPVLMDELTRPVVFLVLTCIMFYLTKAVLLYSVRYAERAISDEGTVFSQKFVTTATLCCNFFSGIVVATLLVLTISIMPMIREIPLLAHPTVANHAAGGVRFVSCVVDLLTWQSRPRELRRRLQRSYTHELSQEEEEFFSEAD